jgi:hypothetical protein
MPMQFHILLSLLTCMHGPALMPYLLAGRRMHAYAHACPLSHNGIQSPRSIADAWHGIHDGMHQHHAARLALIAKHVKGQHLEVLALRAQHGPIAPWLSFNHRLAATHSIPRAQAGCLFSVGLTLSWIGTVVASLRAVHRRCSLQDAVWLYNPHAVMPNPTIILERRIIRRRPTPELHVYPENNVFQRKDSTLRLRHDLARHTPTHALVGPSGTCRTP